MCDFNNDFIKMIMNYATKLNFVEISFPNEFKYLNKVTDSIIDYISEKI